MPGEFLVVAIRTLHGLIIPQPETVLKEKDILMAAVQVTSLKKVRERFGLGEK